MWGYLSLDGRRIQRSSGGGSSGFGDGMVSLNSESLILDDFDLSSKSSTGWWCRFVFGNGLSLEHELVGLTFELSSEWILDGAGNRVAALAPADI